VCPLVAKVSEVLRGLLLFVLVLAFWPWLAWWAAREDYYGRKL